MPCGCATPAEFAAALDALKGKTVMADPVDRCVRDLRPAAQGGREDQAGRPIPANCPRPARTAWRSRACARRISATARRWRGSSAWFAREARGRRADRNRRRPRRWKAFAAPPGALSDLSFDSISGAGSNGAIVHYRVTRSTNRTINQDEMFLIDSGAQYPDGTTDVTRTMIVGEADAGNEATASPAC